MTVEQFAKEATEDTILQWCLGHLDEGLPRSGVRHQCGCLVAAAATDLTGRGVIVWETGLTMKETQPGDALPPPGGWDHGLRRLIVEFDNMCFSRLRVPVREIVAKLWPFDDGDTLTGSCPECAEQPGGTEG